MTILQSLYNAKIFSDIKDDSNRTDANDPRQFLDNNKIFKYISFLFFQFLSIHYKFFQTFTTNRRKYFSNSYNT